MNSNRSKYILVLSFLLGVLCPFLYSCSSAPMQGVNLDLSSCDIVAEREVLNGDTIVVCNVDEIDPEKTILVPLSALVDSLVVTRLDSSEVALVSDGMAEFTDNFIVYKQYGLPRPTMLFDRKGKFVTKVGDVGQGPGEYSRAPHSVYIDEDNGKIYSFVDNGDAIYEYDIAGNFIREIHFPWGNTQGVFSMFPEYDRIMVAQISFSNETFSSGPPVWIQDYEGNDIWHSYDAVQSFRGSFANQATLHSRDKGGMEISFVRLEAIPDTVYYFDLKQQRLIPRFTATFKGEVPQHAYLKANGYYIVERMLYVGYSNTWEENQKRRVIVDPVSLRGGYCKIYNDMLGGIEINSDMLVYNLTDREFFMIFHPGELLDAIDARLDATDLSEADRDILLSLKGGVSEDDNNYIIHARLKGY